MKLNPMHYIRLWREPWRRVFWTAFYQYRRDNAEARRFALDWLGADDMVLDFGGYKGEWAARMVAEHGCRVHVFEPHPTFASAIADRFSDDPRVHVHACALGTRDGVLHLSDAADASSAVTGGGIEGRVVRAADFLADLAPPAALAKVNIEGGEYDLIPALDEADWLRHIKVLQIQFHLYGEGDLARRDRMRDILSKTHDCDWDYPFVWEQWSAR